MRRSRSLCQQSFQQRLEPDAQPDVIKALGGYPPGVFGFLRNLLVG